MEPVETSELPGKYLQSRRQSGKVPLKDVARETRIKEEILKAIEEDDYGDMPRLYIRGFLSAYARCLGLDPNDVLSLHQKYLDHLQLSIQKASEHQQDSNKRRSNIRRSTIVLSVLLFFAVLVYASFKLLPQFWPSLKSESRPPSSSSAPSSPPILKETESPTTHQPSKNENQPEDINTDKGR